DLLRGRPGVRGESAGLPTQTLFGPGEKDGADVSDRRRDVLYVDDVGHRSGSVFGVHRDVNGAAVAVINSDRTDGAARNVESDLIVDGRLPCRAGRPCCAGVALGALD